MSSLNEYEHAFQCWFFHMTPEADFGRWSFERQLCHLREKRGRFGCDEESWRSVFWRCQGQFLAEVTDVELSDENCPLREMVATCSDTSISP